LNAQDIEKWLDSFASTAAQHDLQAHMAHISQDIQVFGVPGFEVLDYQDWYRQCEHEFPQGLITAVEYSGVKLRNAAEQHVLFLVLEQVSTADGGHTRQALEMLLERQAGNWLLKQLRILDQDEAAHHGLS